MILLPRAAGTVNAPPLMIVPAGAVVIEVTWQMLQPTALKRDAPVCASDVAARAASRGGAFDERMNSAKAAMSLSGSSPQVALGILAQGVLSGTVSKPEPKPTKRPKLVFSVRLKRLVMPCSLR